MSLATHNQASPATPVLVINLDSAPDRWTFQKAQFARLGLNATRITAIPKAGISQEQVADISRDALRPFRQVELACLLSHARAWQHVQETGQTALVIEDDVVLSDQLPAQLDHLAEAARTRIVNLETFLSDPKFLSRAPVGAPAAGQAALYKVLKGSGGAGAYMMSPALAGPLLQQLPHRPAIVEIFMGLHAGRRALQTVPALAAQMMTLDAFYDGKFGSAAQSSILTEQEARERPDQAARIRRYLRHPKFALRRLRLESRVALEKLAGRYLGQKLTIQPCPSLLGRGTS